MSVSVCLSWMLKTFAVKPNINVCNVLWRDVWGGTNMRKYMCLFLYADFVYIFVYLIFYVHSNEL